MYLFWLTWEKAPRNKIVRMLLVTGFHIWKKGCPRLTWPKELSCTWRKRTILNVSNLSRLLISPRNPHLGNISEGIGALQAPLIYSSRRFPWIVCMVTFLKPSFRVPVLWIETWSLHLVISFPTVSRIADMRSYHKHCRAFLAEATSSFCFLYTNYRNILMMGIRCHCFHFITET
jgi:hypothetical protein